MEMISDFLQHIFFMPDGMMMAIAPLIGAGMSVASSIGNAIFGGISAKRQQRKQLKAIRDAQRENRNWYNRRYNEDATQRADAQRMLSRANEAIAARNRAAAGKQRVVGGTDASLASTQQANAAAMGDAVSAITAGAEARKDNIEGQYRQRKAELDDQEQAVKANTEAAKRDATARAASGAVLTGAGVLANSDNDIKAAPSSRKAKINAGDILPDDIYKDPWDNAVRDYWG